MYILVALLVLTVSSGFSQPVAHYVKPENFSSNCPGTPCLTLNEYAYQATKYFTTGATFLFLTGNHTISTTIVLQNISDVALRAVTDNSDCIVLCKATSVFLLHEVSNFTVQGMTFLNPAIFQYKYIDAVFGLLKSRNILLINMTFLGNLSETQAQAIHCVNSDAVVMRSNFVENSGGAIYAFKSNLTLDRNVFSKNKAWSGGAISVSAASKVTLDGNIFFMNEAKYYGGAMYANNSIVSIREKFGNTFTCNSVEGLGGALFMFNSSFAIEKLNAAKFTFKGNEAMTQKEEFNCTDVAILSHTTHFIKNEAGDSGGAIILMEDSEAALNGTLIVFHENFAKQYGGAIVMQSSSMKGLGDIVFLRNSAQHGGGIYSISSILSSNNMNVMWFSENSATETGGAICIEYSSFTLLSAYFLNNTGLGGGLAMLRSDMYFDHVSAHGNFGVAFHILLSSIWFTGHVEISQNKGNIGSGIWARRSSIYFSNDALFEGNCALQHGGSIYMRGQSTLSFSGPVQFRANQANENGGAIFATEDSLITLFDEVSFVGNQAGKNGGAMNFESGAKIVIEVNATLNCSSNSATNYGGAIYCEDSVTPAQCRVSKNQPVATVTRIPGCFIVVNKKKYSALQNIFTHNNSAGLDGGFLFGGLLDKCAITVIDRKDTSVDVFDAIFYPIFMSFVKIKPSNNSQIQLITSQPYQLCFCESLLDYNCTEDVAVQTYRGRKFTVSLLALSQGDSITSSPVRAISQPNVRLPSEQTYQLLPPNCTNLSFKMYSKEEQEQLILYLDDSPCRDNGLARAVINVTFLPCPDGFTLTGDQCVCEKRLQPYSANCTIDDGIYITRDENAKFWMSPMNSSNGSYKGLILYPSCPWEYCRTDSVNITLSEPDVQCDHNRSGLLCGACATNYSLTFGSSTCEACSNTYLILLLPFAAAGIALVFFLILLRLTVATGMINSVILYANILQANRNILFSSSHTNILTVFIAWMNLDLGFSSCFYDGMDAYAQTWLQFAFPIYIWILIGLIIFTSRYSMTVTKLIGSNPIAVLATLLLMSYAKLLKIIIEVYSYVKLLYPEDKTVTVWLIDANVPYMQTWHLSLTVVTTLLLIFLFLPYTLLLLLGFKLYYFMGRRRTRWLIKIRPLLDSYYAPYQLHTRYWTGFLLLLRCALFIVFSYNSLGHSTESLFAIIITFSALIAWPWLTGKIYSKSLTNIVEAVVYLNMVVLSSAALGGVNSPTLVLSLVGIVFCIMIGIIIYHFYIHYLAKSERWRRVLTKFNFRRKGANIPATENPATPLLNPAQPPQATKSFVTLREPLLTD